jgi:hypothetical protein
MAGFFIRGRMGGMSTWTPLSFDELQELIAEGEAKMDSELLQVWEDVRIPPAKWQLSPWGNDGGGFWVVAIARALDGEQALYYNDLECGFNFSAFSTRGILSRYGVDQGDLRDSIYDIWSFREKYGVK